MENNTAKAPKKKVGGCKSGGCSSGGCNRMNTFDWLSHRAISDDHFKFVEISFKKGARKDFYQNPDPNKFITGDHVVVTSNAGKNVGVITLSGELVRLQMRKKKVRESEVEYKIIRTATERDMDMLEEVRSMEMGILVRARAIVRSLDLEMKIGDIEIQADKRKTTFYYTAEGRVDFRELIRHYAKEFKTKVEMRQIGIRQEAARIGGVGSCGRELCCSSWMSSFKVVTTTVVRYQNLAINQSKLSGQCGRLKCCLNFELDSYLDALQDFPKRANTLKTKAGNAKLMKTDIFKGIMYYITQTEMGKRIVHPMTTDKVKEVLEMNKNGEYPESLRDLIIVDIPDIDEEEFDFDSVNDVIDLPPEERKKRRRKNRNKNRNKKKQGTGNLSNRVNPKQGNTQNKQNPNPNQKKKANSNQKANPNQKTNPNQNKKPNPNQKINPNQYKQNDANKDGENKPNAEQTPSSKNRNRNKNRRNKNRNNRNKNNSNDTNKENDSNNKTEKKD